MQQKANKRKQQAEATKWNIYLAARDLFQTKGFDHVTVEDIAEAAGVSVGTIYHHYRSKQEIMAHYHAELDQEYERYYRRVICSPAYEEQSSLDKLHAMLLFICDACGGLGLENIRIVYPHLMGDADFAHQMMEPERPYHRVLNALLMEAKTRGEIALANDNQLLIQDLTLMLRGVITEWCVGGGQQKISSLAEHLVTTYLRGLAL